MLRRRKTDTEARPYFIGPETAAALEAWLRRAEITAGPVFRAVHKSDRLGALPLSPRDVSRILKARALEAKLPEAAGVSAHSLRVGMAVDLTEAELELPAIMQAGGWSSPQMVARYTAKVSATRGAVARFYGRR
jgi:integrase